ncbi:hypothetical protein EW146_g4606 [Bondarzewia mesenterica]|uniref:Uncharacterized protein n=1 Tax=Bondarzewia mesenterica TaxID=1095465 RepID=A0A4S4LZS0_9AGAM|nr:hypothetical protein EW146_g4606 [Bondarzewia mesenterica]
MATMNSEPKPKPDIQFVLAHKSKYVRVLIASLELQLRSSVSCSSQLKTRLLATLDTLDALQLSHAIEIARLQRENDALDDRLRCCSLSLRRTESERDGLREAVLQLIEKVELSNDYSLWPHNTLHSTGLIDVLASPDSSSRTKSRPSYGNTDIDHLAYASSLISSLTSERDFERKAHARQEAENKSRIATLEAQVARREAEIESLTISGAQERTEAKLSLSRPASPLNLGDPGSIRMTNDEAIRILERSSSRNRLLKREVEGIAARLENARPSSSSLERSTTKKPLQWDPPRSRHGSVDDENERIQSLYPAKISLHSGKNIPAAESHDIKMQPHRSRTEPKNNRGSELWSAQRPDFVQILKVEDECLRLKKVEKDLRAEFDAFRRDADRREKQLEERIAQLQSEPGNPPTSGTKTTLTSDMDDLDDSESMDLATPLQPMITLPHYPSDPPDSEKFSSPSPVLPVQSEMDTIELEQVRTNLNAAAIRLSEKDGELEKLGEELIHLQAHYQCFGS